MASLLNVQEWLDQCMSQMVSIWCEEPEIQEAASKGMLSSVMKKTFVTYRIKYKQPGRDAVAVRHRYSEFETLRSDLSGRYHPLGILVPAMPPKHSMNGAALTSLMGTDLHETFVKERLLGLTLFCENIISIPWLRHDNAWKAFLRPSSSVVTDVESNNTGFMQLRACLEQMELPFETTMGARVEGVREELMIMDKHVKLLLDRALAVQKCERALQAAHDQFAASLQGFSDSEKVTSKSLAGRTFNNDGHSVLQGAEAVATSAKALADLWECKVQANRSMDFYTGVTLVIVLEQELALIDALKELIKTHDEMVAGVQTAQTKIRNCNNPDQLKELGEALQERKQDLRMFYAGFMYFTMPLVARQRAANFRRFSAGYAACQSAQSFLLHKGCEEFFRAAHVSSCRAIDETNKALQLLQILPIPSIPAQGGEASEGSDDEDAVGAGSSANIAIIPHVAIPTMRESTFGTIQHMDNITDTRNHHQVSFSASANRIPRGLALSSGSTGVAGLFARALMHDKGLSPNTLRAGSSSAGQSQVSATKTMEKAAEGRANPLAARRGSAVKNSLTLQSNSAQAASREELEQGIEVDMYGARADHGLGYVSLRDNPAAGLPATKPRPVNPALLGDLLQDRGVAARGAQGLPDRGGAAWADV